LYLLERNSFCPCFPCSRNSLSPFCPFSLSSDKLIISILTAQFVPPLLNDT
jgi:hypothetical protein